MLCLKCKRLIKMSACSIRKCEKCDKQIFSGSTPCHRFCEDCSTKLNICEECGKSMQPDFLRSGEQL